MNTFFPRCDVQMHTGEYVFWIIRKMKCRLCRTCINENNAYWNFFFENIDVEPNNNIVDITVVPDKFEEEMGWSGVE